MEENPPEDFWKDALKKLELNLIPHYYSNDKIPQKGRLIVVANHAFGVADSGFILNPAEIERILFAFFIIFFLIFEPRGMWGIWFRLRNYFKAWPFSY